MKVSEIYKEQFTVLKQAIINSVNICAKVNNVYRVEFDRRFVESFVYNEESNANEEVHIIGIDYTEKGEHFPMIIKTIGGEICFEQIEEFEILELIWILEQMEAKTYKSI